MNQTNLRKHSHINHPYYGLWSLQFWGASTQVDKLK